MSAYRAYTGIGSRKTPKNMRPLITRIARRLDELGYTLRSGGADGADTFFEHATTHQEIYLPWPGFNGRVGAYLHRPSPAALRLASERIDGFDRMKQSFQKLLARNMHQVFGKYLRKDLRVTSRLVICWTPGGRMCGGTRHAWQLAVDEGIPVFNLARPDEGAELLCRLKLDPETPPKGTP